MFDNWPSWYSFTICLSHRRMIALAKCRQLEIVEVPGRINSFSISMSDIRRSISFSILLTFTLEILGSFLLGFTFVNYKLLSHLANSWKCHWVVELIALLSWLRQTSIIECILWILSDMYYTAKQICLDS